jgi:hypothetical protein
VTGYQLFLLAVLAAWPLAIVGLLFLMSRLEEWEERVGVSTPREAGLEPVKGSPPEREVRIVFGDKVVGEPDR